MPVLQNLSLLVTALLSGLIAGLFYAYSCSVTIGLGRLPDAEYLRAMQSVNRAILNPYFFISFIGTLVVLPLSTWANYSSPPGIPFYCLLIACVVYLVGVFGVTVIGNVPLNEALDKFNISNAAPAEISGQRALFEAKWNRLNMIRTVASILSFMLVTASCLFKGVR